MQVMVSPASAGLAAETLAGSAAAAPGDVGGVGAGAAADAVAVSALEIFALAAEFADTGVGGVGMRICESPIAVGAPISPLMMVAAATADQASREPCMIIISCV